MRKAQRISRVSDADRCIQWLRSERVRNVIITSSAKATAFVDGDWITIPRFEASEIRRTVGAGDVCVGTFAAALTQENAAADALQLSQAAAGLFVSGREPEWAAAQQLAAEDRANRDVVVPPAEVMTARQPSRSRSLALAVGLAAVSLLLVGVEVAVLNW